jgi:hypothetical protein
MKNYIFTIILFNIFLIQIPAITTFDDKNVFSFLESKGQMYDQFNKPRLDVLFSCDANNIQYFFKKNGISYQLSRIDSWKDEESFFETSITRSSTQKVIDKKTIYRLDITWLNANNNLQIQEGRTLEGYNNYYSEVCPNGIHNVKNYNDITYKSIYNGINLHYYSKNGNLKYDYIVAANADYKQIQLKVEGAENIKINKNGELVIKTPLGYIVEHAPIVKQKNKLFKATWVVTKNVISFKIDGLDSKYPFIIDPMIRLWGTLYGGSGLDVFLSTCIDKSENVYVSGQTNSPALMATIGSHQFTYSGGSTIGDALLVKFNKFGVRKWATYYGGSDSDVANNCTTDKNNNIFIIGHTRSTGGIATVGAHQTTLSGDVDAFFVKFDSMGVRSWASYYGDVQDDGGSDCSVDDFGNVVFIGGTRPPAAGGTILASPGAHKTVSTNSTVVDGFIAKFNSNGVRLWATYYGDVGSDDARGGCIDKFGNIYLSGATSSSAGIATAGSYQSIKSTIGYSSFLAKFDSMGVRQWGTYYGGNSGSGSTSCAVDKSNNIYICGSVTPYLATSATAIATLGSHQSMFGGGIQDGFLAKFNSFGNRIWATYYGGDETESAETCATDNFNNVYIVGQNMGDTLAQGAIATVDGFQNVSSGAQNAYIVKFDSNGVRKWGSFYGQFVELGYGCAASNEGYVYLAGQSGGSTSTIIASPGAYQTNASALNDGFLVKFFGCENELYITSTTNGGCFGISNGSATVNVSGGIGYTYTWVPTGGNLNVASNLTSGSYTCFINNVCNAVASKTITITQPTSSLSSLGITNNTLICAGETASLIVNASGGIAPYFYLWSTGNNTSTVAVSPSVTTIYTVTVKDNNNCLNTSIITQIVDPCVGLKEQNKFLYNVSLFPNPNNSKFTLEISEDINDGEIVVFNELGQKIFIEKVFKGKNEIKMPTNSKGIYHYQILQNRKQVYNGKFIVE